MLVGVRGVRRLNHAAPSPAAGGDHAPGLRALLDALRDKQYRWLVASYLMMSTTTHLVLAAVPYYATYELGRPKLTTVLVAAFVAPAMVATPLGVRLARRIGKQSGLLIAQATFVVGCVALAFGRSIGIATLVAAVAVLGIAFAACSCCRSRWCRTSYGRPTRPRAAHISGCGRRPKPLAVHSVRTSTPPVWRSAASSAPQWMKKSCNHPSPTT